MDFAIAAADSEDSERRSAPGNASTFAKVTKSDANSSSERSAAFPESLRCISAKKVRSSVYGVDRAGAHPLSPDNASETICAPALAERLILAISLDEAFVLFSRGPQMVVRRKSVE
jgi:hypothetical protein